MLITKMTRLALALLVAAQLAMAVVAEAELEIEILTPSKEGCRGAKAGDNLKIHYDGKLSDGTRFDSSYERNQPLAVALGKQMVIAGMEKGLEGACIGEVRMLTIPPHLGYGDRGAGGAIPGGATIMFKVEVVEIEGAQPDEL